MRSQLEEAQEDQLEDHELSRYIHICRYLLSDHKNIILSTIDLRTKVDLIHRKDSLIERHGQLQLLVVTMVVKSCEDKEICYLYV